MINIQFPSTARLNYNELLLKTAYLCEDTRDGEKIVGFTDENRNFIVIYAENGGFDAGYNLNHHIEEFRLIGQFLFSTVTLDIKVSFK